MSQVKNQFSNLYNIAPAGVISTEYGNADIDSEDDESGPVTARLVSKVEGKLEKNRRKKKRKKQNRQKRMTEQRDDKKYDDDGERMNQLRRLKMMKKSSQSNIFPRKLPLPN